MRTDGRTDGRTDVTKVIVAFRNFAEESKEEMYKKFLSGVLDFMDQKSFIIQT